jgi:hypothetical protein
MLSISIDLVSPTFLLLTDDFMWTSYTVTYSDLAAAAGSNQITLATLPAKTVLHGVALKHSAAFGGGTIATYTVSVGLAASPTKYASAFNVFQAPGDTVGQLSVGGYVENFAASTDVKISAVATGGMLNAATSGSVTVWLLTTKLP